MTTALILVLSLIALLQFFMSYCRAVIAASGVQPLSDQLQEITGVRGSEIGGDQFWRLLQLARLCPESGHDNRAIAAIKTYFRLLNIARAAFRKIIPSAAAWTEQELSRCAYFAAIALDRRITYSRGLMAEQVSNQF